MKNINKTKEKMKTLTQSAQVAKLIKKVALQNGMKVKASSSNFSNGCSVTIYVLKGSDKDLEKLRDYSDQFEYGKFDGMNDIYEYKNVREDIPQTKYLSINDERANEILKYFDENIWKTEKKWMWFDNELRHFEWLKHIKEVYQADWQKGLINIMEGKDSRFTIKNVA